MKRTVILLAVVLVASAPVANADHGAGGYRWPGSTGPIPVVDNLTSLWDSHLAAASAQWNRSSVLAIGSVLGSDATAKRERCRAEGAVVVVCNATYEKKRWLGLTTVITKGSKIVKARVRLNDTYFTKRSLGADAMRKVMCHELGHAFGLGHQHGEYGPSCMDDRSVFDGAYSTPNSHDYAQLEALYAEQHSMVAQSGSTPRSHHHYRVRTSRNGERTRITFLSSAPAR